MKKLAQIIVVMSAMLSLTACSSGSWMKSSSQQPVIDKNACIGVASYLGQPQFMNAQLKSSSVSDGKKNLPTYWHSLPNYQLDQQLINSISHSLKSQGMSCVVPLYRHDTHQSIDQFLAQSVQQHHLQYVILVNQGSRFEKEHTDVVFLLKGYGIFYTYSQGMMHNKPVTKLYASLNVNLLNQQLTQLNSMPVNGARDIGESIWQSQFDQLNPNDTHSLVAWLNQAIVPEVTFRSMNLLHLTIMNSESAIH